MSHALTEVEVFSASVVVPDPGELVTAASVTVPFQSLANRTQALARGLPVPYTHVDNTSNPVVTTNTLTTEDAAVLVEATKVGDVIIVDCSWEWNHTGGFSLSTGNLFKIDDIDATTTGPDEDTIGPGGVGTTIACQAILAEDAGPLMRASLHGHYIVTADGDSSISVRFGTGSGSLQINRINLRAILTRPVL